MALSQTLESYLENHQAEYDLAHHELAVSSLGVARVARVDEKCLAKSVLLMDHDRPLLAVLPASRRLELSSLRQQFGSDLRFAREAETQRFFPDCELGAMPPVGAAFGLKTVIDQSLELAAEIFFEAGDHETLVHMRSEDFFELMSDSIRVEIAVESADWMALRRSRERLYGSILAVSDAIAAPAARGARWRRRVRVELQRLRRILVDHIAESEAHNGLLRQIEERAPRLARSIDGLRDEHVGLMEETDDTLLRMDEDVSSLALRECVMKLLWRFSMHRHRGADLVYEAYGVDIGGGS